MPLRMWIGSEPEDLDNPPEPGVVSMSTGTARGEPVLSITWAGLRERRGVVIDGRDVMALLKVLAVDPRYQSLFDKAWARALKSELAMKAERSAALDTTASIVQEHDLP
jgi:hypothetical protein